MTDWPNDKTALLASVLIEIPEVRMETMVYIRNLTIDNEAQWCEFLEEWTDGLMRRGWTMNYWYAWRTPEMKAQDVNYDALRVLFEPYARAAAELTLDMLREWNNIPPHVRKAETPQPKPEKPPKAKKAAQYAAPPAPEAAQMSLFTEE